MPVIETPDPLSAGIAAAAGYLTQQRQNKYDAADEALRQQQISAETANSADEHKLLMQQIAAATNAASQTASNRKFESSLQLPKNWGKMTPEQKISYLQVRQTAAQRAGDSEAFTQAQDEINSLGLDAERIAQANYTAGPRSDLTRAQTWQIRTEKPREFAMKLSADAAALKARLGAQWNTAVMREQGAMARNADSIGARELVARMNNSERTDLATMAAYNRMQGMDEQMALKTAVSQYQGQMVVYKAGLSAAEKAGGDAPQQFMQQNPMPTINISTPSSSPQIIMIPNPANPNGAPLPVVQNHPTAPVTTRIDDAVKAGIRPNDPRLMSALQQSGYSEQEIRHGIAAYNAAHAVRRMTPTKPVSGGAFPQAINAWTP